MADFSFLNDDGEQDDTLPGSKPGASQPYQMGTKESADKKMSDFGMQSWTPPPEATVDKQTRLRGLEGNAFAEFSKAIDQIHSNYTPEAGPSKGLYGNWSKTLTGNQPFDKHEWLGTAKGTDPENYPGLLQQAAQESKQQLPDLSRVNEAVKAYQAAKAQEDAKDQMASKMQQGPEEAPVDHALNMNAVLTAAGWDRKDFIQANSEVRRIIGTHGINPTDPVTPSTFPIIVPKIVEEVFKPEQAQRFFAEINGNPEDQKQGSKGSKDQDGKVVSGDLEKDPRFKEINNRVQQSEARHDAVWRELAHSGNFQNVGDVIGFVLTSLVLGPKAGAALFSNMNKNGGLRNELAMIDRETTQLYHRQNSYIQLSMQARNQALREEHQKDQLQETNRHNVTTEGIQYGRMKALADKMPDKEMRNIAAVRLHGLRMAESNLKAEKENLDRLEKAANNPMDPRAKVAKAALMQKTKDYSIKVSEMQKYRGDLQKWFEQNADKVGGAMFPGTQLGQDNFSSDGE